MRQMFLQGLTNKNRINKLKSNLGESLVETLVAMMIVVMAMTMLAGAIRAAAKVNEGAEQIIDSTQSSDDVIGSSVYFVTSEGDDVKIDIQAITVPSDVEGFDGYCYYTVKQ